MTPRLRPLGAELRILAGSPLVAGAFLALGVFLAFTWGSGVEWIGGTLLSLFVWGPLLLLGPVAGHVATVRSHGLWTRVLASPAKPLALLAAAIAAPFALFGAYLTLAVPFAAILVLEAGAWWLGTVLDLALGSLYVAAWVVVAGFAIAFATPPRSPAAAAVLATALSFLALAVPHVAEGLDGEGPAADALARLVWLTPERPLAVATGLREGPAEILLASAASLALAGFVLVAGLARVPGLDPAAARGWRRLVPALAILALLLPVAWGGEPPPRADLWNPGAPSASPTLAWRSDDDAAFEPVRIALGRDRTVHFTAWAPASTGPVAVEIRAPPGLAAWPRSARVEPTIVDEGASARYDLDVTFRLDRVESLGRDRAIFVGLATRDGEGQEETVHFALVRDLATPHADAWGGAAMLLAVGIPTAVGVRVWRRLR